MLLADLPVDVLAHLLSEVPLRYVYYLLLVSKIFHEAQMTRRRALLDLYESRAHPFVRHPCAFKLNFRFLESSKSIWGNNMSYQFNDGLIALAAAILPTTKGGIGVLGRLEHISFMNCQIGDTGFTALSSACANGSLKLKLMYLSDNRIGNEGMKAFAAAAAMGSMRCLNILLLARNQISDEGIKAFADTIGSLGALEVLSLGGNKIGDAGMAEFSHAISSRSLGALTHLNLLQGNQISDAGVKDLSRAISSGSLVSLRELGVDSFWAEHPQLKAACEARSIWLRLPAKHVT